MLSFVEAMHGGPDGAAAGMFEAMTKHYGFSARAAATYELHAEQDTGHGDRQIEAIRRFARDAATQDRVRAAVKLGLEAFNFEWDGHVQAMTGERAYWRGLAPKIDLATPEFRLPR
jgi:pyrroloquinoline quinone (PQQ) biosynthesis protein C